MSGTFNWGAAIGPGIPNRRRMEDDLAFVAALKQIRPEDLHMGDSRQWGAEREEELRQRNLNANHPTVHCNRFEPAGNMNVHDPAYNGRPANFPIPMPKNFGAQLTVPEDVLQRTALEFPDVVKPTVLEPSHEPHGVGSHELPDVVSPEEWIDRYTHISACKAIILLEAGFLRAVPQTAQPAGRQFIQTTVETIIEGRVWDIVRQKYLDVGWAEAIRVPAATELSNTTTVRLYFP